MTKQLTYRDFKKMKNEFNLQNINQLLTFYSNQPELNYTESTKKRIEKQYKKLSQFHEKVKKQLDQTPIFNHPNDEITISQLERLFKYDIGRNDFLNIILSNEENSYENKYEDSYRCGGYTYSECSHNFKFNRKFVYEQTKKMNKNIFGLLIDNMILIDRQETEFKDLYLCRFLTPKRKHNKHCSWVSVWNEVEYFLFQNKKYCKIINAKTSKTAMTQVKRMKKKEAKIRLFEKLNKDNKILNRIDLSKIVVNFNDSINAGNCKVGTQNFIEKHNLKDEILASELLQIENSHDIKRAVLHAIKRNLLLM